MPNYAERKQLANPLCPQLFLNFLFPHLAPLIKFPHNLTALAGNTFSFYDILLYQLDGLLSTRHCSHSSSHFHSHSTLSECFVLFWASLFFCLCLSFSLSLLILFSHLFYLLTARNLRLSIVAQHLFIRSWSRSQASRVRGWQTMGMEAGIVAACLGFPGLFPSEHFTCSTFFKSATLAVSCCCCQSWSCCCCCCSRHVVVARHINDIYILST